MRAIREFFRPIDDARLPQLRHQLTQAAKGFCLLSIASGPPSLLLFFLTHQVRPLQGLLFGAFQMVVAGIIYILASRSTRIHPEHLLFAQAVNLLQACALGGSINIGNRSELIVYTGTIVLLITTLVPWRPTMSLLLSVPAVALLVIPHSVLHQGMVLQLPTLVFGAFMACTFSAIGAQLQRGLWLKLDLAQSQLIATDRMSELGRMTAGIAHELKTPLAAALNGLERSQQLTAELRESIGHPGVTPDDLREIAAELDATVALQATSLNRASRFVHAIRSQTVSANSAVCVDFHIEHQLSMVTALLAHRIKVSRVTVDVSGVKPSAQLTGDAMKFDQILTNLIGNAVDACDESGTGTTVRVTSEEQEDGVLVVVEDDGPGVPGLLREQIFQPFFTTRASGEGTGLGLYIARQIAESTFGGTLRLVNSVKGGRFELWCPRRGARARSSEAWTPFGPAAAAS